MAGAGDPAARRVAPLLLALALVGGCAAPPEQREVATEPLYFPPPPEEPRFVFERSLRSSADVESRPEGGQWRRALTGEGAVGTALAKPFDVTACGGRVYVSDTVQRSVMVFDVPGGRFFEIGSREPGLLQKPLGLSHDRDCNLYVADGTSARVMVYDPQGRFLRAVGGPRWFDRLSHVAVDGQGRRLYAVDTGAVTSTEHWVRVFDAFSGEHLADIGTRGVEPGQFNLPRDVEVGPDGRVYVVDGGNFRVQVLDPDGTHRVTVGQLGRRYGQFARPKGVALDAEGNIYVSDSSHGNFQIFDDQGRLLLFVGSRSEADAPAGYMLPAGIDIDEDGRVYMVDQFFKKVDVYRPAAPDALEGRLGAGGAE